MNLREVLISPERGVQMLSPQAHSGERPTLHEHCGLIADVDELAFLAKFERVSNHDTGRANAGPRLSRREFDWWADSGQSFEVGPVNTITESGPALVPAAAVKEIGV